METKTNFKTRLIQEGRWDEFLRIREDLKAQGISPKDAWAKAKEKFVEPIPTVTANGSDSSADPALPVVTVDLYRDKANASARQIVQWVFDNIDVEDVKPEDAPSAGAWSFLHRIRKYPDLLKEFYRSIWARMLPSKAEIEAREKFEDDGREQIHLIDQIKRARDKANE